jgi:hypothetical protein
MTDWLAEHFNKDVPPFGRLVSAHTRGGERLYFFDRHGSISLVPAELVDAEYAERLKNKMIATELQPSKVLANSEGLTND